MLDRDPALLHHASLCAFTLTLLLCADTSVTPPSIAAYTCSIHRSCRPTRDPALSKETESADELTQSLTRLQHTEYIALYAYAYVYIHVYVYVYVYVCVYAKL